MYIHDMDYVMSLWLLFMLLLVNVASMTNEILTPRILLIHSKPVPQMESNSPNNIKEEITPKTCK